jgi:hypothetical protein
VSVEQGYENVRQGALQDLADGEPAAAFSKFRSVLEYPVSEYDRKRWRDALEILSRIAEALKRDEASRLARDASRAPEDALPLHELAQVLLADGLPGLAATMLARARSIAPESERVSAGLAVALGGIMRHAEARDALLAVPGVLAKSPRCRGLLALHTLMTGELEEARTIIETLPAEASVVPEVDIVRGMLARADAVRGEVSLDRKDLRGWHYVINGGILLHLCPFSGMNGRYVWLQDSPGRLLDGARRMSVVLDAWQAKAPRIFVLPDRDSAILAHTAASVLRAPLERWPQGGSTQPGLIVVYDLATLRSQVRAEIAQHRAGQPLWVHASCWTTDAFFTGDFTTLLHQTNTSPFRSRPVTDFEADTKRMASEVLDSAPESSVLEDYPALVKLAQAVAKLTGPLGAGAFRTEGPRRRQLAGSPVARN